MILEYNICHPAKKYKRENLSVKLNNISLICILYPMKSENGSDEIFFNKIIWQPIYNSGYFSMTVFGSILYVIWLIYFISRFLTFHQLRRSTEGKETLEVRYRCKTEYYKFALLIAITLVEPFNFIPHTLAYGVKLSARDMNQTMSTSFTAISVILTLKSISSVLGLVTISLLNVLTVYMSYVNLCYTEFTLIKRKLWSIVILAVILSLSSFILVIGALIVQLVSIPIAIMNLSS